MAPDKDSLEQPCLDADKSGASDGPQDRVGAVAANQEETATTPEPTAKAETPLVEDKGASEGSPDIECTDALTNTAGETQDPVQSSSEQDQDALIERIASAASAHAAAAPSEVANSDAIPGAEDVAQTPDVITEASVEPKAGAGETLITESQTHDDVPGEDKVAREVEASRQPITDESTEATAHDDTLGAGAFPDAPPQDMPTPFARIQHVRQHGDEDILCLPTGKQLAMSYAGIAVRGVAYCLAAYLALIVVLVFVYRFVDPPASTLMLWRWVGGAPINQTWVPIEKISPNLIRSVIVAEDGRFCQHRGIDLAAMKEAIENARGGIPRGASTISMQVTKNVFLWPSRSVFRKIIEIPVTVLMELVWPKRRVLEVYLNVAEGAPGVYGAEAAARHHFKRAASRLSTRQSALLAAALPNPFRRDAGDPGPRTSRKARVVQARARASKYAASCVLPVSQRRSKRK